MPPPWRPKDYAEREFRHPDQRFRAPNRKLLERHYRESPEGRWKADDPGNLPGAVLSWFVARKVTAAMVGISPDQLAEELGLSPIVLRNALAGREPFPIEYVAALAERFGLANVSPTPAEFEKALVDRIDVPPKRPARRGLRSRGPATARTPHYSRVLR